MSAVVRFRSLLNDETEDLYNLCKEWTKVLKFTDVTDEVAGKIHSVVGKIGCVRHVACFIGWFIKIVHTRCSLLFVKSIILFSRVDTTIDE